MIRLNGRIRTRLRKAIAVARHAHYWPAAARGTFPTVELEQFTLESDIRTVIDVGANRGQFLVFALARFPQARVLSFEPNPPAFRRLQEIIDVYGAGDRARAFNVALGDANEERILHVSREDDSSSLLAPTVLQVRLSPESREVGQLHVLVQRLDSLIDWPLERPTLLKIDVQGFELEVLRGASATLSSIDSVLVEMSFVELYRGQQTAPAVMSLLQQAGYREQLRVASAVGAHGEEIQVDALFVR